MAEMGSAEEMSLAVKVYKRIMYLQAEGFTEVEAHRMAGQEFGLDD